MSTKVMGVDVGGTKTEVCLLELPQGLPLSRDSDHRSDFVHSFKTAKILARKRMKTESALGLDSFSNRLKSLMDSTLLEAGGSWSQIQSLGLGLPGSIDPETQVMAQGSISFLKGFALNGHFARVLGFSGPIYLDNDANCFALAELLLGAGSRWALENKIPLQKLCMIGVTLGTGVGGGLIVNGQVIRGRRGGAGEIGHITLVDGGRPCYCGKFGCSEQYLSGPGFELSYQIKVYANDPLSASEIFQKIQAGDPLAVSTLDYYREHLVQFLSNISNLLDPHVIVLGGGMSTQSQIYPDLSLKLSQECFLTENPPAVLPHECGDSAGVLGAAMLPYWEEASS